MRKPWILLVALAATLLAGACTSPTMPPYPTPDETKEKPQDPNKGLSPGNP